MNRVLLDSEHEHYRKICYISNGYPAFMENGKQVYLHRLLMAAPSNRIVDHINGNTFDCRVENLRICTQSDNLANASKRISGGITSIYKGVSWRKSHNMWQATITKHGLQTHLGYFKSETEAAIAYNAAAIQMKGNFAKINEVTSCA